MDSALVILGNQLFPLSEIDSNKYTHVFMAEDHGLCTHYKYHKHKIIFFLSSMRSYKDELESKNFEVTYYDATNKLFSKGYEKKLENFLKSNKKIKNLYFFEIEDKFFEKRMSDFCSKHKVGINFLKSPMFLTSREDFKKYLGKYKKPFMKNFYQSQRKNFSILLDNKKSPLEENGVMMQKTVRNFQRIIIRHQY